MFQTEKTLRRTSSYRLVLEQQALQPLEREVGLPRAVTVAPDVLGKPEDGRDGVLRDRGGRVGRHAGHVDAGGPAGLHGHVVAACRAAEDEPIAVLLQDLHLLVKVTNQVIHHHKVTNQLVYHQVTLS